jgi:hypothetical protein
VGQAADEAQTLRVPHRSLFTLEFSHGLYAWRHTYKRRAARSGIERRVRFAMCGHTSSDERDRYETPSMEDMAVEGRKFPRYEV